MVIYLIRNRQSGQEYVGTTVRDVRRRWADHLSACFTKRVESPLYAAMRASGKEAFDVMVLEECEDYTTLLARERAVILDRRTLYPHGYNMVKGGKGNYGWVPSPDVRRSMSNGQRGRVLSAETKAKLSAFFKGRPNHKNRVARGTAWNKGVPWSDEMRASVMASRTPRPWSAARRAAYLQKQHRASAAVRAVIAEKKRTWWAWLSPEARAAHVAKMTAHMRKG